MFEDDELCQAVITSHWRHSKHSGCCPDPAMSRAGENPACGDLVRLSVTLEAGLLSCVRHESAGCAVSMASASLVCSGTQGRSPSLALEYLAAMRAILSGREPVAEPGEAAALRLLSANPARIRCALVAIGLMESLCHEATLSAS